MADAEIDDMIKEIMRQKPEIAREEIEARIVAKKEAVGANYLTDRGAVFLVAGEYGVSVGKPIKTDVSIKDIYVGASEVTLEARILCASPIKQYTKKDGGKGSLRLLSIYDSPTHTAGVKIWGEKAETAGLDKLKSGDYIKISKAFVKEDRDGSLAIHVGSNSTVEPIESPQRSDMPSLEEITVDIGDLPPEAETSNLAVSGVMDGDITLLEYTRQQTGERATALKMRIRGADGTIRRVVLWGKDMSSVPKRIISTTPKVILLGVSTRRGQQQQQQQQQQPQDIEIHGNESTQIIISDSGDGNGDSASSMDPLVVRIIAKPPATDNAAGDGTRQPILAVDSTKRLYSIMDTAQMSAAYNVGEIVECMPSQIHGTRAQIDSSSFMRSVGDNGAPIAMPTIDDVITPVQKADSSGSAGLYCISCIVINKPERREIQTKTGDVVYLAEMGVGDGTGETVLKAWRNQSRMFEGCEMGSRYVVAGIRADQGMAGTTEFTLTEYSEITKASEGGVEAAPAGAQQAADSPSAEQQQQSETAEYDDEQQQESWRE